MPPLKFQPGFRISASDVLFVMLIAGLCAYVNAIDADLAVMLGTVCLQFFLFCNVFRIRRRRELIWAAIFLAGAAAGYAFSWKAFLVAGFLLGFGLALCGLEMFDPSYHGIGWRVVNPRLEEWFHTVAPGVAGDGSPPDPGPPAADTTCPVPPPSTGGD